MKYYLSKLVSGEFMDRFDQVKALLNEEGFGILTEINVQDTLKKKLDTDYKKYIILGTCNPHLAIRALQADDKIGTLLPCNVVLLEQENNMIEVAIMNPVKQMNHIGNPELEVLATEVYESMNRILNKL